MKAGKEILEKYEVVVGLEVHAQLQTKSKAYSPDSAAYGALPNTNVSTISLGHPGTLPVFNERVLEFGVRLGLAVGSEIRHENQFARKNYFYADLPKGYQITQDTTPLCTGGAIEIKSGETTKLIGITRIHMEEDSGKSIHDLDPYDTLIDLNRAGVPLLEIVSEPDIRSPQEAYNYLMEVRKLVRYLEICDGNMEEGSLRCDANVSVRLKGSQEFGQRTETKNLNSMRNVYRAIEYETMRQSEVLEGGGEINMETMGFDAVTGATHVQRSKEMAHDYRYFPEPDLAPVLVEDEYIQKVKSTLPPLPKELIEKYTKALQLSQYDAEVLTEDKFIALYYEQLISFTDNYKAAANWVMGAVKSYLNDQAMDIRNFSVLAEHLAELIGMVDQNLISNSLANQKIFPVMVKNGGKSPKVIAEENNWLQESDDSALINYIELALNKFPEKVKAYQAGNKNLLGLFMGEVMKASKGKADPKKTKHLIEEELEK